MLGSEATWKQHECHSLPMNLSGACCGETHSASAFGKSDAPGEGQILSHPLVGPTVSRITFMINTGFMIPLVL